LQIVANGPLISLYGEVMRLDQDNFPEAGKKLLVIRAPSLFKVIWNVVKHFFDPGVRSKMVFCGLNDFREVLSEYVDLEILPDCVVPGIGVGKPILGMPPRFEGGPIPE
jgi:CRAL/TRIO domain